MTFGSIGHASTIRGRASSSIGGVGVARTVSSVRRREHRRARATVTRKVTARSVSTNSRRRCVELSTVASTTPGRVSMMRGVGRRRSADARVVRAASSASPAYDLDFVAKPSLEEVVASVGIGVAVASAYVAMRASNGATPLLTPLGRVVTVVLGVLGAWVARVAFVERRYADALVSHKVAADDADSEFVRVDGVDVHFKRVKAAVSDSGCRRVVECAHGFGANLTSWTVSDSMSKLSRALEADVLAHDSCGFGLTERSVDVRRYTRASDARTCCAVLREGDPEGTKSRVVVGHSLGAVSAALACALEKIDHVVLVAPAILQAGYKPKTSSKDGSRGRRMPLVFRLAFAFFAAAFSTSAWCLISLYKPFLEFLLHQLVRSKGFWNKGLRAAIDASKRDSMPEGWIDGYRKPSVVKNWDSGMFRLVLAGAAAANSPRQIFADAFARARATNTSAIDEEDAIRALVESDARVLIVHGENDVIVPASNSRKLAETLGAELKIIPTCGHMPQEERCDEFVSIVRDFIV